MISSKMMMSGVVGGVAGALLWKRHRVWGYIVGSTLASGVYYLAFDKGDQPDKPISLQVGPITVRPLT